MMPANDQSPFETDSRDRFINRIAKIEKSAGGGGSGDTTDDWKASVERRLGELHDDIRALLNRGIITVVALAGMVGGLYLYTNGKFDTLNQRMTAIEIQQAKSDATVNSKLDLLVDRLPPKKGI